MRPWNPAAPFSMDEITRFRWQLIADETIGRAFAEAGIDALLAQTLEQLEETEADIIEPLQFLSRQEISAHSLGS